MELKWTSKALSDLARLGVSLDIEKYCTVGLFF